MPYPENFAVRLIVCLVGMLALWFGVQYVKDVLIFHEAFTIDVPIDFVVPIGCGIAEAFVWKPKDQK